MKKTTYLFTFLVLLTFSCSQPDKQGITDKEYARLSDEQKRSVTNAIDGIVVEDDRLELTLFASEPMMINPTNMDIDDRGRVWIAEAYNYRSHLNPRNPTKAEGDRILIMEDTNGDGVADESKVFYQGNDINAALGIAVLGDKVYVSVSPYVYVFTDADGDDVPEKKEILFEGVGGVQHDHGMHAFTFGPDGKLYFNYGNEGKGIHHADGSPILDPLGRPVNSQTQPYREGMVFRMNPDGSDVEVLAWNFRNNYEVAVDSYGRMWQSDNDDDGNRATRINYVMDFGNYGFKDEITGADWRTRRINMEDSIPLRHWHLNDPGVVPNMLQTFAGSPTGILVYEGNLLPEDYQGQIIHSDAGPNIVRAYIPSKDGAGFTATIKNLMDGNSRDNWFRPSDVTVAPDGSLFVSDWYDPGVGGHAMGDQDKGRVYRLAPKGVDYKVSAPNYDNIESLVQLLQNPNRATHFKAFMALVEKGDAAKDALETLFTSSQNPRMKARAFWVLTKLPNGNEYIQMASTDADPLIRVAAVRASRINQLNDPDFLMKMAGDEDIQVRREVALAIRYQNNEDVWLKLANSYQSGDRWFLEALGIAADGFWDEYLSAYLSDLDETWMKSQEATDIVWRSRSSETPELLGKIILSQPGRNNERYYRALDFQEPSSKTKILKSLLASAPEEDQLIILRQINFDASSPDRELLALAKSTAGSIADNRDFLDIVRKYEIKDQKERLKELVYQSENNQHSQMAANIYSSLYGIEDIKKEIDQGDEAQTITAIEKFGTIDNENIAKLLAGYYTDESNSTAIRTAAMEAARGFNSEPYLWELVKADKVPADLLPIAQKILLSSWNGNLRAEANAFFGDAANSDYDLSKMLTSSGSVENGKTIASNYCLACHKIGEEGIDFGPGLSEIGDKLSKEGLFNAIINPSEGMGFGYETQLVKLKDGTEFTCIVNSKTENDLIVKLVGSSEQKIYKLADVESVTQQDLSLMPKFPLSETELVDLVSYLETLRK
ncbi:PVC-type heme-binding CxxCH protein [Algoriphagus machipongonensis]|uniref:Heme-binding domain-containing protein n=1 Tax=Algoriphagus machipongonensis TaxID=388413 RepID=A3HZ51_9BACT|nr:PVC-type heme-binding CxxCH protein [Algoriphagus machipongonensis]EAZ80537.1 heme-binding domain-containing protein [Algoriphagus machipongonensis]